MAQDHQHGSDYCEHHSSNMKGKNHNPTKAEMRMQPFPSQLQFSRTCSMSRPTPAHQELSYVPMKKRTLPMQNGKID
jgi:hypothetical protein